jgi:hypothetical protein
MPHHIMVERWRAWKHVGEKAWKGEGGFTITIHSHRMNPSCKRGINLS